MSRFGLILAGLNILGAVGLVYIASQDYGKRQSYAYATYRTGLILDGLPVTELELGEDAEPLADRFSGDEREELFRQVGGNGVMTQAKEVERLKRDLDNKLGALAGNRPGEVALLARILLALTNSYHEREQLLGNIVHFRNEKSTNDFKALCLRAFNEAKTPPKAGGDERPVSEVFRLVVRAALVEPAEVFVTALLKDVPEDRKKAADVNFDTAFANALERQRETLQARYNGLFAEASGQAAGGEGGAKLAQENQRAAIARLLFGLCPFLTEETLFPPEGANPDGQAIANLRGAAFQAALVGSAAYKQHVQRALTVCGLRATIAAMAERSADLQKMADYAGNALVMERQLYTFEYGYRLERIREQASIVRAEQLLVTENKTRLEGATTVVKERLAEIQSLDEEYKKSRQDTADEAKKLKDLSQQVMDLRVRIRDAITANEQGEERIRALETQVRDLEKKK